ncbi:DUF7665 family protein [Nocardioides jiangxiensis]|uniref:Uncharacterized protein n=1 Tax=Nocardioides jiangxiensis TaxID=3064524 RepID=A0ABT9B113_9ACTN|nr:hypothetical protein [Nocardioides sp. WY-20]MDO7868524.1 hypothetical protein [Nocardioides sp. WY-20]
MNEVNHVPPDEQALDGDLRRAPFLRGQDGGLWSLVSRVGTVATFTIVGRSGRTVGVRLDCAGYPFQAPTGQLWSVEADAPLPEADWPTGGAADAVFNPNWCRSIGVRAFYFPYDRAALNGHDGWKEEHPGYVWGSTRTVVDVLRLLHATLATATGPAMNDVQAAS